MVRMRPPQFTKLTARDPEFAVPDAPTLPQQLKQHLDALRAAGIDFVPKAGPSPFAPRTPQPKSAAISGDRGLQQIQTVSPRLT